MDVEEMLRGAVITERIRPGQVAPSRKPIICDRAVVIGNGLCTLSNGQVVVEFGVLGPVGVWVDGQPADAGHARQRAVLAVLLLEAGRAVPLEVLVDRVWGEDPPRIAACAD
jgi:hypothetical protein